MAWRRLTLFCGFDVPRQRIALKRGPFSVEIWPELGEAIANLRGGALRRGGAVKVLWGGASLEPRQSKERIREYANLVEPIRGEPDGHPVRSSGRVG